MKALSIKQPWAWAIMAGHKRVENRTWRTSYRGRLLIHAGKRIDKDALAKFSEMGIVVPKLVFGAILGTVELVNVLPIESVDDPWATGPWCWMLERPEVFAEPVPYKGQQSLFNVTL